ncbi:MAG: acyl carrier protein [Nostoc sp. ChiSLP02]|nr:acyl carrier protein [Nostoc sp. DedSLP05]MDZ8103260.1 acyl carrier protein [Nostoc sp. DedSLP01]MDZ8187707.1 acyl carrier protein [Nostoc sp. ChiSLP02]
MLVQSTVKEKISDFTKIPISKLQDEALLTDVIAESFVLIEMIIELQEEYRVCFLQEDLQDIKTVGDLTQLFVNRVKN